MESNGSHTQMKSWTNSLKVATHFSDPNRGRLGRMNLMQLRMIRRGLKDEVTTTLGMVLVTVAKGISVKELAVNGSENEFWLPGGNVVANIQVSKDKEEIETILESIRPKLAQRDIEKLSLN